MTCADIQRMFGVNYIQAAKLQTHIKFAERCAEVIEVLPDLKSHPDLCEAYKAFQAGKPNR